MTIGHADRLWVIGGAIGAAVLLALGWFLLISPQNDETATLQEQAAAGRVHVTSLKHRLAQLRRENADLDTYKEQLLRDRQALPTEAAMSDFVRQLQSGGDAAGVSVRGVMVGSPAKVTAPGAPVYALPVTLTASGPAAKLDKFLDQLQQVRPRAVLISSANAVTDGERGTLAKGGTMTVNLQVFAAPSGGAAPAAATK